MPLTTEITSLPAAVAVDGSEKGVLVQGGTTKQFAVGLIMAASAAQSVQTANTVFAGPTTGAAATPTFRTLVAADIPASAINLQVGSTPIASGTTTRILYDNAGVLGEYTITGSGTVVAMQTSPAFTTPSLGVATATSLNKVSITTPASSATLTIANGKTLTVNASLTLAGTDSTTMTFPSTSDTVAGLAAAQTLTKTSVLGIANVRTFGATGDGVTNDTVAIQAAIDSQTGQGGIVFFPPGTYVITSTLTLLKSTRLIGSGMGSPDGIATPSTVCVIDASAITGSTAISGIGNDANHTFEEFWLKGPSAGLVSSSEFGGAVGIDPGNFAYNTVFRRIYVSGFTNGIVCQNTRGVVFENIWINNSRTHGAALNGAVGVVSHNSLYANAGGVSAANRASNFYIGGSSTDIRFYGPEVDEAFGTSSSIYVYQGTDVTISGTKVFFTVGGYGIRIGSASNRVTINDVRVGPFNSMLSGPTNTILIEGGTGHALIDVTTDANGGGDISDSGTNTVFVSVNTLTTLRGAMTITQGTIAADAPQINGTVTWNNAGVTFTAWKMNVTNTASAAASLLADWQVGSVSKFSVNKDAAIAFGTSVSGVGSGAGIASLGGADLSFYVSGARTATFNSGSFYLLGSSPSILLGASSDTIVTRDAANILGQRNGATAQTIRVYNTFTDASNYERAVLDWTTSANNCIIGTQNAGTGAARNTYMVASGDLNLCSGGTNARWVVPQNLGHLYAGTDNTYDIGASGASRPRNLYVAGTSTLGGVVNVAAGTATPAAGSTSARLLFGTTAGFGIYYGSGSPTVSAAQGSIYLRSDGSGTADRMYVNTNGTTGWTNFTTAA